jgi:F0F1-type ATP synthase assembly protein I
MVAGPIVGYFIGDWLDDKLGTAPYLVIVMIIFGFVSSGREFFRLLKLAADGNKDSDDDIRT